MIIPRRVRTIYCKELIDILRDRRTLIAMILVPIVLYPLLMLGSIQAISLQAEELHRGLINIAVVTIEDQTRLRNWLQNDSKDSKRYSGLDASGRTPADQDFDLPENAEVECIKSRSVEDLIEAVRKGACQVGVIFEGLGPTDDDGLERERIRIIYDGSEGNSEIAAQRLRQLVDRQARRQAQEALGRAGLSPYYVEPYVVKRENVATPKKVSGQILGMIVPLILVLMTITSAIYPAIDLTAGERERGTLETLMVCPVPVVHLVAGKFLVVTTVALMGAALNLLSVGATLYFGGFGRSIVGGKVAVIPLETLPIILFVLIPLAVLFSAILIAVCSYARTFKEAQNYITPVIMAVLIPGGIASLPGTELSGLLTVTPVANMVLLTKDLLLGHYDWGKIATVFVSTSFYAVAAAGIATKVFGQEAVAFAESGSLRSLLSRRRLRPKPAPSTAGSLALVAILFPVWFYIQGSMSVEGPEEWAAVLRKTAGFSLLLFLVLPIVICVYARIDIKETFSLRPAPARAWLGALLIGASSWTIAHEATLYQAQILGGTKILAELSFEIRPDVMSLLSLLVWAAILPAINEEMLFRGFLQSGLRQSLGMTATMLAVGCIFAVFHFLLLRFAVTAMLGAVLAFLCWQARSVFPAILAHVMHNGLAATSGEWGVYLGLNVYDISAHYPTPVILGGITIFVLGLVVSVRALKKTAPRPLPSALSL